MVLQEIESSDNAMSDGSPASDIDTYGSQTTPFSATHVQVQAPPHEINIALDKLSVPILTVRGGDAISYVGRTVKRRCELAVRTIGRPLKQEEAEAFAQHISHGIRLASFGFPVSLGAVAYLTAKGWKTYSFPGGWAPGKSENSKLSPDRFLFARGTMARMAWQAARISVFTLLTTVSAGVFFNSYALTTMLVRDASDPRLKDYNTILRTKAANSKAPVREQDQSSTTQGETFEQRRQRRNVQETVQRKSQGGYDDASPTGGFLQSEVLDIRADTGLMTDAQSARQGEQVWQTKESVPAQRTAPQTPTTQRVTDAHDTVSSDPANAGQAPTSAWDRLRQQAVEERSKRS